MGKEHPFTMSLTTEEIFYIQTVLSMHKEQLEKRREIFKDGDLQQMNQGWLVLTETLIGKFEQVNQADFNRLIGVAEQ